MDPLRRLRLILELNRPHLIARRYFVTNGFDGALTMLGLTMGFQVGGGVPTPLAVGACLSAAIALAVSGVSSAYISEAAERQKELRDLERAMVATDLGASTHGEAARGTPLFIALVNGASPLLLSLVIIAPLWLAQAGVPLPTTPLKSAIATAFAVIFLLGVFAARISGTSWIRSGLRTLLIALATAIIIFALRP